MVKKEQIQKELEMRKQENKALQKTIGELNAEIVELKKELEAAKNADANSDGSPSAKATEDKPDGRAPTEGTANSQVIELKGKIGILLGAIAASCKDHCPHHLDENACRNCSIYKSVFNAGFEMPKEIKNEE